MGGSGGRYYSSPVSPRDLQDLVRASEDKTEEKLKQAEAERVLQEKLKDFNDHDFEGIDRHREEIKNKLSSEFEEFDVVLYGGSHARHTDVNGISDVDVLAVLGSSQSLPPSSRDVLAQVAGVLTDRFPNTPIKVGKMAVTLTFSDGIEMQVVPALRSGNKFLVPDRSSNGWTQTCPSNVAEKVTELNGKLSGKLVPTIKLAKALCNSEGVPIKSYHLENMALQAFESYNGKQSLPHMLQHFFKQGKALALNQISDPCGQSADISSDLTKEARHRLASEFRSIEGKIENAIQSGSSEVWDDLL